MDLKYFSKRYVPSQLKYREKEQDKVRSVLRDFYGRGAATCLLIQGYTGCGKTATIKNVIQKEPWNVIYTSGNLQRTHVSALRTISGLSHREQSRILEEFVDDLADYPRAIIVDEITKIKDYAQLVQNLNAIHREVETPIFAVTNNRMFLNKLPDDVRTTLCFQRLNFRPYSLKENKGIIKQRLELADAEMPEEAIERIAAIATRQHSARIGINIAKQCLLSDKFSSEFIKKTYESMEREEWRKTISMLNPTETKILNELIHISEKSPNDAIRTKDLVKVRDETFPLSTVSNIVTTFEEYGIVSTEYVQKGKKGGRYRKIYVNDDVKKELSDEVL